MHRKSLTWDSIKDVSAKMFGPNSLTFLPNPNLAVLASGDIAVAILAYNKSINRFLLHLRASLSPDFAGFIAAAFASQGDFDIAECMELDDNGKILAGDDAVEQAAQQQYKAMVEREKKAIAKDAGDDKIETGSGKDVPIFVDNQSKKDTIH